MQPTKRDEAKQRMPKWATWSVEEEIKLNHLENQLNAMIQGLHIEVDQCRDNEGRMCVTYHTTWDATKIDLETWFPGRSEEFLEGYGLSDGVMVTYPSTKDMGCETFPQILNQVLGDLTRYMGMRESYEYVDDLPMPPQDDDDKEVE